MADLCLKHGQLKRVCDYCELEAEIAALRAELEQAQENIKTLLANHQNVRAQLEQADATIARQRAWIESAGHRPGCAALYCNQCGRSVNTHVAVDSNHAFETEGICDCGYAELVGG